MKDLNGRWMKGRQYLYMPEENWPKTIAAADEVKVSKKCPKVQLIFQL